MNEREKSIVKEEAYYHGLALGDEYRELSERVRSLGFTLESVEGVPGITRRTYELLTTGTKGELETWCDNHVNAERDFYKRHRLETLGLRDPSDPWPDLKKPEAAE